MTQPAAPADPHAPQQLDIAAQLLSLLRELESSLHSGQRALLARDVEQLEDLTRRQSRLRGDISVLRAQHDPRTSIPDSVPDEVRLMQIRIVHLTRIHRGLLARSNRRLLMLSHLVTGTHADYSLAATHNGIFLRRAAPASPEV